MNHLLRFLFLTLLLAAGRPASSKGLGEFTSLTVGSYKSDANHVLTGPYQGVPMPFLQTYRNTSTAVQDSLAFTVQCFGPNYAQALQEFFGPLKGLSPGGQDTYALGNIELPGPGSYLVQVAAFTYDRTTKDWVSGPVQVYWLFPTATPLPVELVSFTASYIAPTVSLSWQTASETNCLGFEVQRSDDGQTFAPLVRLVANGSTSAGQHYGANDRAPFSRVYYRLRVINTDSTSQYSPVVSVAPPRPVATVYPNPARDQAHVPGAAGTQASLYDAMGRLNRHQLLDKTEVLDLRGLTPGTYLLIVGGKRTRLTTY